MKELKINVENIVEDIVKMSEIYGEVAQNVVDLNYELKLQKSSLDREAASLDNTIRSEARTKKTETAIKNEVILSESYVKMSEKILETERQLDEAKATLKSYDIKVEMLKLLGKDFVQSVNKSGKKSFKKF